MAMCVVLCAPTGAKDIEHSAEVCAPLARSQADPCVAQEGSLAKALKSELAF